MKVLHINLKKDSDRYMVASQILSELHRNTGKGKFAIAFPEIETGKKQSIGYVMQVFFENPELITNKLKKFLKFAKNHKIVNINLKDYEDETAIRYKRYNGFIRTTPAYIRNVIKNLLKAKEIKRPFEEKIYNMLKAKFNKDPFLLDFNEAKNAVFDISVLLKKEYLKTRQYPYLIHYSYTNIRKNNANPTAIIEIKPEKGVFEKLNLEEFNNFGLAKGKNTFIPIIKDL